MPQLLASLDALRPVPAVVTVTQTSAASGAPEVAAELALAASHRGTDVALVDAAVRHPRLYRLFDVPNAPGLGEVVTGQLEVAEVGVVFDDPPLRLLTAGTPRPGLAEEVAGDRLAAALGALRERHELVVVHLPPADLTRPPAALLHGDAVVVVVPVRPWRRRAAREAEAALRRVTTAPVIAHPAVRRSAVG